MAWVYRRYVASAASAAPTGVPGSSPTGTGATEGWPPWGHGPADGSTRVTMGLSGGSSLVSYTACTCGSGAWTAPPQCGQVLAWAMLT